ncbi:hypothetical protein BHM03_00046436 [Ensete ventricosum]|nr:hypothetical protein BHM03_00046436 [Ensete ventricosum]
MLEVYDGSSDPTEHVATFHVQMTLYGTPDAVMCWAFLTTLRGIAGGCHLNFHDRDQAFPPLLVAYGVTPHDCTKDVAEGQPIREKGLLKTPNPLRSRANDQDNKCYCRFHRDYGHDTEECYDFKNQIEDLIYRDHLDRYIMKPRETSLHPKSPVGRHIDVIVGGPTTGGVSSSARKAYARTEVQKRPRPRSDPEFTFEYESEYPDHDDALVVMAHIANAYIRRIMIDTGSSADILYLDAFHKLGMTNRDLIPMTSTLIGFTNDAIILEGSQSAPEEPTLPIRVKAMLPSGNDHP